jgi:hypothetical protein
MKGRGGLVAIGVPTPLGVVFPLTLPRRNERKLCVRTPRCSAPSSEHPENSPRLLLRWLLFRQWLSSALCHGASSRASLRAMRPRWGCSIGAINLRCHHGVQANKHQKRLPLLQRLPLSRQAVQAVVRPLCVEKRVRPRQADHARTHSAPTVPAHET